MWAMTKGNKGGTCLIHTPQMLGIPCNSLEEDIIHTLAYKLL